MSVGLVRPSTLPVSISQEKATGYKSQKYLRLESKAVSREMGRDKEKPRKKEGSKSLLGEQSNASPTKRPFKTNSTEFMFSLPENSQVLLRSSTNSSI